MLWVSLLGTSEIIYYPYWCLEKGYARFTGPNEGSEEWLQRDKGWIRVMQFDCYFAMIVYTMVQSLYDCPTTVPSSAPANAVSPAAYFT